MTPLSGPWTAETILSVKTQLGPLIAAQNPQAFKFETILGTPDLYYHKNSQDESYDILIDITGIADIGMRYIVSFLFKFIC